MTNELGTTLADLEEQAKKKEDALGALEKLSAIAHLNLHGNVEKSQYNCISIIRKYIKGK